MPNKKGEETFYISQEDINFLMTLAKINLESINKFFLQHYMCLKVLHI